MDGREASEARMKRATISSVINSLPILPATRVRMHSINLVEAVLSASTLGVCERRGNKSDKE
jgi:hypothetical protein